MAESLLKRVGAVARQAANVAVSAAESGLQQANGGVPPGKQIGVDHIPWWELTGMSQDVQKAGDYDLPVDHPARQPKAMLYDPFTLVEQLGYKEKTSNITYQTLRAVVWRVPLIQAVLQTRLNQVYSFATIQRDRHRNGYKVRKRDMKPMNTAEKKEAERIERLLLRSGNPLYWHPGRKSFGDFLRMIVWDSLVYDQMCFEVLHDRKGRPAEWNPVDAASIRLADNPEFIYNLRAPGQSRTVQVLDNMVVAEWPSEQLAFCVRNPNTNLQTHGYGTSELEMMIPTITSLLWAFQWNAKFFSQGAAPKGIINFKGVVPDRHLRAFRRHWFSQLSSVTNAWRTPITNAEGLEWINLQMSARDMEFSAYIDFLIKIVCALYQMDPIEVNFKYGNTGQNSMFESANKQKLVESKDKGLRPLLQFLAEQLNNYIVQPINEDFSFAFLGIDAQTPEELAALNEKRVKTYMTVNEIREEDDKPPLPDDEGDVILDPTWMQFKQAKIMMENGMGAMDQPGATTAPGAPSSPNGPFGTSGNGKNDGGQTEDFQTAAAALAAKQRDAANDDTAKSFGGAQPAKASSAKSAASTTAKSARYTIEL